MQSGTWSAWRVKTVGGMPMSWRQSSCRPQLVARPGDRLRLVEAVDAHHLELPHHRQAVEGDRRADPWDDGVHRPDRLALVEQLRLAAADADVELERVEDADVVAAGLGRLGQHAGTVQFRPPRQDDDAHGRHPPALTAAS
jgi:hypothetical protein